MNELHVSSELVHLRSVRRWVARAGVSAGLSREQISDLQVAVGEAFTNSVKHGYRSDPNGTVVVTSSIEDGDLVIRVLDEGSACSVDLSNDPDLAVPHEGGYGIYLMKLLTDRLEIRSGHASGTEVVLRKRISRDEEGERRTGPRGALGGQGPQGEERPGRTRISRGSLS